MAILGTVTNELHSVVDHRVVLRAAAVHPLLVASPRCVHRDRDRPDCGDRLHQGAVVVARQLDEVRHAGDGVAAVLAEQALLASLGSVVVGTRLGHSVDHGPGEAVLLGGSRAAARPTAAVRVRDAVDIK